MSQPDQFIHVLNEWIAVFMHRSMQNLHKYSKESGYSMSQIFALTFIHHRGTCGVTDLGEGMGVSSAAASQLLEKLVQQGFIERTEDPADRRGKQITLTPKGSQIVNESFSARKSWFGLLENLLSEQEKQRTISMLEILIEKGKQLEPSWATDSSQNMPTR